jgi:fucose permease
VPPFQRDRHTWLIYGQLAIWGYFLYAFSTAQPLLQLEQGTTGLVAGLHGTAMAVGAIASGAINAPLAHWVGRWRGSLIGVVLLTLGMILLIAFQPVGFTLTAAFLGGLGGSIIVNMQVPLLLDRMKGASGERSVNEANAAAALVGAGSTLLVGILAGTALGWRWGLLPAIVAIILIRLFLAKKIPDDHVPDEQGRQRGSLPRAYWMAWSVLLLLLSTESAMAFWGAALVRERTGLQPGSSTSVLMVMIIGMGLGRLIGANLTARFPADRVLIGSISLGAFGFFIFWSSTSVALSFVALFLIGLGLSLHYPLAIVRLVATAPDRPDLALGRSALGAGAAIGTAPVVLGALADAFGIVGAYVVVPIFLLLAVMFILLSPVDTGAHARD